MASLALQGLADSAANPLPTKSHQGSVQQAWVAEAALKAEHALQPQLDLVRLDLDRLVDMFGRLSEQQGSASEAQALFRHQLDSLGTDTAARITAATASNGTLTKQVAAIQAVAAAAQQAAHTALQVAEANQRTEGGVAAMPPIPAFPPSSSGTPGAAIANLAATDDAAQVG